jgi:hypothetical protein
MQPIDSLRHLIGNGDHVAAIVHFALAAGSAWLRLKTKNTSGQGPLISNCNIFVGEDQCMRGTQQRRRTAGSTRIRREFAPRSGARSRNHMAL